MHWVAQEVIRIPQVNALDRSPLSNSFPCTFGKGRRLILAEGAYEARSRRSASGRGMGVDFDLTLDAAYRQLVRHIDDVRLSNSTSSRDTGRDLTINWLVTRI